MAAGLYEELFAAVVSLINRYGAAGVSGVMAPSWGEGAISAGLSVERHRAGSCCCCTKNDMKISVWESMLALGIFYGVLAWGQRRGLRCHE